MKYQIVLLFLFSIVGFLPYFGSIDVISVQYLYLTVLNSISLFYIVLYKKIPFKIPVFSSFAFFIFFIFVTFISLIFSEYLIESTIEILRFLVLLSTFFIFIHLLSSLKDSYKVISQIILFLLLGEILIFYFQLYLFMSVETEYVRNSFVSGVSINQNISSFLLLYKIPFLLFLIFTEDKRAYLLFYSFVLFSSSFAIFLFASRGAIIGVFLIILLFIILLRLFKILFLKKHFLIIFLCLFTAASLTTLLTSNNNSSITNRLSSFSDSSVDFRVRSYKQAIDVIKLNPIIGTGIGTWKINAINYDKLNIKDYQSPYHVHNDWLQIAAETGLFGLLFYSLTFFFPIFQILKNRQQYFLPISLAIVAFSIDSFINFPKHRPVQFLLILLILSLFLVLYNSKHKINNSVSLHPLFFLFLSIALIYPHARLFYSYVQQKELLIAFNNDTNLSNEYLSKLEVDFPSITVTSVPLKAAKAHFEFKNGNIELAKRLSKEAISKSPYFYFSENLLANIYLNERNIDSALYFSKLAFDNLPNNAAHSTTYTRALEIIRDIDEIERVFDKIDRGVRRDVDWKNYLAMIANYKSEFTDKNKSYANKALELYPDNKEIFKYNRIINYGIEQILEANSLDSIARIAYENKDYYKAIEAWNSSISIVYEEPVYYQGIAKSYAALGDYNTAVQTLDKINENMRYIEDGYTAFLKGGYFFNLNQRDEACKNLFKSQKQGYIAAKKLIDLICN